MNDLIASTQQYHSQNSTLCDSCGKSTKVRTRILDAKQFIVVKWMCGVQRPTIKV